MGFLSDAFPFRSRISKIFKGIIVTAFPYIILYFYRVEPYTHTHTREKFNGSLLIPVKSRRFSQPVLLVGARENVGNTHGERRYDLSSCSQYSGGLLPRRFTITFMPQARMGTE